MKEKNKEETKRKKPVLFIILLLVFIIGGIAGYDYWNILQTRVYTEKAVINAPIITLSPLNSGTLDRVMVKEGDSVRTDMILATINGVSLKSKTEGEIISVQNIPGQFVNTQTPLIKMINPKEFRVIGTIDENKGFNDIKLGQKVEFIVDAFEPKKYYGTVDSISPSSRQQDIIFSISDKRAVNQFDVKVSYDINKYPELKNGMSAKIWIYK